MFTQDDWLNRVNAPYLDAARKREAGFLPSNFADQFEEIPERGFWDSFTSGAKAQGAGVLQGQAEFVNALGIGNGDFANTMNQVMQENARRREFTWQDMVNDPMKYISDPEGLMYDLGGAFGSTGVLLGETALTGGVGGAAARAMGLAGKIGGTARMIAAIDKVAKANNMPWVHNILVSPAGKMLALNIMKTPFEAVSEGGNVRREIRETGGTEEEQLSGMLSSTALNAVLLTFTNSLESAGLGKLIAKEGGKDALVKKLTGVTQTAAKEASKPNFVQKMNLLNKVDFATVGKTAVGLTANALQNAYEEGAQETIGQYAKGEKDSIVDIVNPFAWSDEALTGAAIGGVTGAAQGAVMTGVGKGLNKAFGFEEKKPQELKVTTPAKQENVSGETQQNLEPQEQPQAQVQEQVHPQVQAQVQGYEEAFGVDEESVKAFEEKQRQQLSQAVANGVDEEVLQAEENRKNQLLDILGIDIPQFTGAKKQEQPKVAPQSPIKPKAWNQPQKGGYIGRYSDESIKKALNKSDAQLKEFALKIQNLNDKDQMKIAVYNELKKRGIDMGKGFMMEEPEAQLEVYKPKFSDIPAEKLANAAQWYADKPQQFEQDYQNAISRLQRLAVNNDAAKELLQNLQQFREAVMSYQKIQQENKPLLALQQGIPEEVLQAVEENPEEAALIFEEDAERFVAENIDAIEDVNERKKQARLEKENAHEYLRSLLKPALDILNAGRNKGYSLVPGNQDNGRKVRMSNNDLWYQEFRKEKQHKPLVEEMEELAYLLSIDKFPYSMPYEFAEILNTEEYQEALPELKQQLDFARAYYFALKEAYDKTLEESKQAVKSKGEKNEKGKSEPKRTETSESKDDGNTESKPIEEKKTDGEVEGTESSAEEKTKPTPKQSESAPQQEKKAESKETPAKEEKVAENGDFPARIGNYELVPIKKGSPSNMRDYQNPSNPNSDFYNVLVDNQTGVVYVTGSGMTEDEELGFPSMQDAVNFIRDGEAYKGLSAKEVKSKQAMVKRMENGEVAKPAKTETPKVPKATQAVIDYVKEQINLDLTPYLDDTFKAKRGQMNIRITSMPKVQLDALKMFVYKTSQGHGSYQIEIEDLGNWGITLKFKKQDSSNPVKYSATELDKKFQAAYHGSPHIFNEFSLEYIGTGEGAQVHGWGLYFAESERVAKGYRERLSHTDPDEAPKNVIIDGIKYRNIDGAWENTTTGEDYDIDSYHDVAFNAIANQDGDIQAALNTLKSDTYYSQDVLDKAIKLLEQADSVDYQVEISEGSVFEVDIPEDDVLLDEEKTFAEQSPKVQEALQSIVDKIKANPNQVASMYYIDDLLTNSKLRGRDIYYRLSRTLGGNDRLTSLVLNDHGIKGITYVSGQDGRCYVIFDDKAIAVKRRYETAIAEHQGELKQSAEKLKEFLKDALKGGKFELQDNGDYKITMPNGVVILASVKDQILINPLEMQGAKAAHGLKGDAISILGSFQKITSGGINALINLSASTAKNTTAYHEATHALIELALTPKQKQLIFDTLKPMAEKAGKDLEEFVCDYVADWRLKRKNANLFGKLWQKVFDMAKRLQAWFTQTENMHNLLRKIETGEVWKQTAEAEAKQYSPVSNKYFATDLAERFQEFLHGEEDVFESEQYKKHNELRNEAQEQSDALWKEYKALDEKIESLMPSLDSDKAKERAKELGLDLDFYSDRGVLRSILKDDIEFELKEVRKQKHENYNKRKKLDYEVRRNRILAERIVQKASRQLRRKHFFIEPPKPTNKSEFEGFTIEKTGMSYYDDILETLDVDKGGYRIKRSAKHGVAYIAEMSPLEYMDRCALEIFNRTYHSNLYGALLPVGDVDKYADMMKNGTKFNLPMLNYNSAGQEGRHRALAAYLNGIDKIPVLVVGTPEYNVTPKKFSAEEAKPQTPTAIVATATKDSQPKGFWETVSEKGFFKTLWDKFYTDWVDKFRPLQAIDSITEQNLGRPLEKLESVRGQATAMNYRAAGVAQALLDGDEKAIEILQSMLRKKGITLHKATLQMVLDKIKPSEMNSKYGKNWLKENGLKTWHQGLSNYLFANRVKEMYDIRWQEYLEALEERAKAIEDLTDEQKEQLAEYDAKVDEWNANGREPDKRPRRPKDIVIPYKQKSTGEEVNLAKKPLWEDSEWGYNLPQNLSIGQINAMIKTSPKEFEEAAEIYYKLNDNLLMVLQDADIINSDVRKAMNTKYQKYCPLMRDFTDTADAESFLGGLTSGGKSIGNVSVPIHKIKAGGSERAVTSPLESTINAIAVFTQRAERNKVAQLAVEMTRKSGATNLVMEAPKGTTPSAKDSTFTVMYDGKKKVFACKPELYGAIAGYNIPTASMVFKVASKAANYLRLGATTSPSFILRNFIRDTIFAGISSKNGFIPIYDSLRGMYLLQKDPEMRAKFHAAGVDQFNFFTTGEARYKKLEVMSKEDNRSLFNPMKWIEAFRDYSELVEASTRMGEFARALERGKSIFEAAEDARNVTLNFTRMGARGEQLNKVIPFFNACIQGGDKMIDMFRKDFVGTCINTFMYIVVPSIVLWGLNHNEDWYKKLNPEIKNNYWCFGKSIKIPKPQEIGVLFGSGTESVLDEAFNKDKKAVDNWWKAFSNNVIPSFVPTILLPMYEWQANYSFFSGKEVVSKKLQRLPDELQYNQGTSEISKFVGSTAKISPIKLDNAIRSITGTMGMFLYQTAGMPFEDKKHEPTKYWYERQFFRDFTVTDMNLNRNINDFYEIHSKSEKQHAGYGKKGSPSIATKNIRNAYKAISDINKDIQKIQTSTNISPDRKRLMLDNKRKHIDKIAEKIVRKYGEHYL